MCDCQKYKVIKAENGILIEDELNNFDLSQLDWLEDRMYNDFIKHSTKSEALQIIINSVEGDYSQLSPKLAEIAEKQDCEEEFKNGGSVGDFEIILNKINPILKNKDIAIGDLLSEHTFISGGKYWRIPYATIYGDSFKVGDKVLWLDSDDDDREYKGVIDWMMVDEDGGVEVALKDEKEKRGSKWFKSGLGRLNIEDIKHLPKGYSNGGGIDGLQFTFTINIGSGFKDTYSKESWKKNHPELFDSNDRLSLLINQPINEDFQLPDFNDTSVRSLTKWVNENIRVVVKSSNGDYTSKDFKVRVNYDNDFKVEGNPMSQLKSEIKDYFNSLYYVQSIQDKDFGSRYLYSKNYFTTEPSFKELENYLGNRPKDKYNISAFIHKVSDGDIIDYNTYISEVNPSPYLYEDIDHKYKKVTFSDDFGFEKVVTFKELDKSVREFIDKPDAINKIKILQDFKGKLTPTIKDNFIKSMKPYFKASIYAKNILNYNDGDFELSLQSRPVSLNKMSNGGGVGDDGYTLNQHIVFKTSGEDGYISGDIGGDNMDLINIEKIGENEYSAIAKSYNIRFEDIEGQELEDEIFNTLDDEFSRNDLIEVWLDSVTIKYSNGGGIDEWKSGSSIKFKTKKEAERDLDLMKNHNKSDTEFRNLSVKKINYGDKLNDGWVVTFEYRNKEKKYSNGGGVGEIKVGDKVTLPEIKMPNSKVQFEKVENGEVLYIENGIYGVLDPKTNRIHQVNSNQIQYSNGGGIGFIGKPEHYRYLTIQKVKNGLLIILNEEGVEELNDIISDNITSKNPKSDTDIWLELFEDVQGNSEYIFHSDMGESGFGMTSAEGITDGYYYEGEDRSNLYKTDYPESAKVYWFPNYMVERSISTLINKGEVFFTEAESMSNGGGIGNQNALMVLNDNKQIKHHTEELNKVVNTNTEVPAWVVSKVHRSASDLSDATHYLDGANSEFKNGGGVGKTHKYKLGDKYRSDFDYDGMLEMGLKANTSWGYNKLVKLHNSFEDVNYHSASKPLWEAIQNLKNGNNELAESNIIEFHKKVKEETMFNPDITDMEMENGGTIDSNRRFTEGDFNKLTYNGFTGSWSGYVWEIYPEGGGKVLGKFNPKKNTLFIAGKKDLSNPLVKYLQENSYVSSEEYVKLKNGGSIFGNMFGTGRSKSALAKDRKYFNASEKHEVNYATTFKRKKKTYNTFNNGGGVDGLYTDSWNLNETKGSKKYHIQQNRDGTSTLINTETKEQSAFPNQKSAIENIKKIEEGKYNNGGGVDDFENEPLYLVKYITTDGKVHEHTLASYGEGSKDDILETLKTYTLNGKNVDVLKLMSIKRMDNVMNGIYANGGGVGKASNLYPFQAVFFDNELKLKGKFEDNNWIGGKELNKYYFEKEPQKEDIKKLAKNLKSKYVVINRFDNTSEGFTKPYAYYKNNEYVTAYSNGGGVNKNWDKFSLGGGLEEIVRNKNKNDWKSKFDFYLQYNANPISKGDMMKMAYESTRGVDSAIPQSLWSEVDNTFFYVYDYTSKSFGELVDLRIKLKFSNVKVNLTIVVNGDVFYKNRLPDQLQNITFHQALDYVFNHDEVEAFNITPISNEYSNGGNLEFVSDLIDEKKSYNRPKKKSFSAYLGDVISISLAETALGRKINSWNDDIITIDGVKYKKVYLRPEYKKI